MSPVKIALVAALTALTVLQSACIVLPTCHPADSSCSPAAILLYLRQPITFPRFLYAVANTPGTLLSYTIDLTANQLHFLTVDTSTGLIGATNAPALGLSSPVGAALDATGTYTYAVNNSAPNSVHQYAVAPTTGVLASLSPPTVTTGSVGRLMAFDPLNRFAVLAINTDGTLVTPAATFATAPGTGPADLAIHPTGKFLYVLNQTGPPYYITQYAIDATSGALTSLGVASAGLLIEGQHDSGRTSWTQPRAQKSRERCQDRERQNGIHHHILEER